MKTQVNSGHKTVLSKILRVLGYTLFLLLFLIGTVEIGFRVAVRSGWFGLDYGDVFSQELMNEGGFLKIGKSVNVVNGYGEKVQWITNSKGFRNNKEFDYDKPKDVIRILSIGDSFTAGYRVGQNETYSYLLQKSLNEAQDSVRYEVMVSCVQNPLQGLEYLSKYGLKYKPDIVLLGITLGNDLSECFIHLHNDGQKKLVGNNIIQNENYNAKRLKKEVLEEVLPEYSYQPASELNDYLEKFIFPKLLNKFASQSYSGESIFAIKGKVPPYIHDFTHGLGIFLTPQPETIRKSYERMETILKAYNELSIEQGFNTQVILFPQRFQVNELDAEKTITDYHLNSQYFDWELPNRNIGEFCEQNNLNYMDPLDYFRKQTEVLYLPNGDMHWNSKGHKVISDFLFTNMLKATVN